MRKQVSWYAAGLLALAMIARAGVITYNATLVNDTALAHDDTFAVDLQANGIGTLSAQAYYSTATVSQASFGDGRQSTGSFTVLSYAALSSATATNSLTVASNLIPDNASIAVPGYTFTRGQDWAVGNVSSNTAESIKVALAHVPWLSVSRSGSVVYTTATYGSRYNAMTLQSNTSSITATSANFSGGQDNAFVKINGVVLTQGREWSAITSNSVTATNLKNAINSAVTLNTKLTAGASGPLVTSTSTRNGSLYNYSIVSSTPTALSASGALMVSGTSAGFTLGSHNFTATNGSGLTLALPVLYSGTPEIGGLTAETTYYAIPVTGNTFELSKYSTSAVAGIDLVTVTSTNTQLTANTYTLSPLGVAGNASFKWQVSNDNETWTDLAVSSVTQTPTGSSDTTIWSFGFIGTQLLRLKVVAPTAGGLHLRVQLIGTN